jgi:hypothetical protein
VVFANETLALSKAVDLSDDLGVVQMIMILGLLEFFSVTSNFGYVCVFIEACVMFNLPQGVVINQLMS